MVKKLRVAAEATGESHAGKEQKVKKARKRKARPVGAERKAERKKAYRRNKQQRREKEKEEQAEQEEESDVGEQLPVAQRPVARATKTQEQQEETEEQRRNNRIVVTGLPKSTTEKKLRRLFGKFGVIINVRLALDKKEQFRGVAFITYKRQECSNDALQLDGYVKKQATLSVKKAVPAEEQQLDVYIAGLPFSKDRDVVYNDFSACGRIKRMRMLTDQKTGRFSGAAVITFVNSRGVNAALKYDGTEYGGRQLRVSVAKFNAQRAEADPPDQIPEPAVTDNDAL